MLTVQTVPAPAFLNSGVADEVVVVASTALVVVSLEMVDCVVVVVVVVVSSGGGSVIIVSSTVSAMDQTPVWKFFDTQWLFRKLMPSRVAVGPTQV